MKNIRFYTIAVLFGKLPISKVDRCLHKDIQYSTFDIGSHRGKLSSRIGLTFIVL